MDKSLLRAMRVVVDECVGLDSPLTDKFRQTLQPERTVEMVRLSVKHRGIPDMEILRRLLGPDAVLLTMDHVLHNQALALGFRSYTLNERGDLFGKRLSYVSTPKPILPARSGGELRADYVHPPNPIARALKATLAERDFERYRTRRRRIRSYFGSEANISSVSLTVGSMATGKGLVSGYFLALAGYSGVKGLRASEGYALTGSNEHDPAWCLIHALRELYLLQLETTPAELYIIPPLSLALCRDLLSGAATAETSSGTGALHRLLQGLASAKVFPCVKGPFFDAMEKKLHQMAVGRSNELVVVDFHRVVTALHCQEQTGPAEVLDHEAE